MTTETALRATGRDQGLAQRSAASPDDPHTVELTWIGNGAWRACDTTVPANDARGLIAYVECINHRIEVTWVNARRPRSYFESLRDAYTALNRAVG